MKNLIFTDLHADARTAGYARFDDARQAVECVVDRALVLKREGHRVRVIFAGDLCDPDHVPTVIRSSGLALEVASRLRGRGIESSWLVGNHDVIEDGLRTTTLDPLGDAGFSLIKIPMYGQGVEEKGILYLPYTASAFTYDPVETCHKLARVGQSPGLIVAHLMVEGLSAGSESDDFARGRDLFLPLDTIGELWPDCRVVVGHYHKRQTYRHRLPNGRDLVVEAVGSMLRLTRAEAGNTPQFLEIDT